jgi:hypothetical protein
MSTAVSSTNTKAADDVVAASNVHYLNTDKAIEEELQQLQSVLRPILEEGMRDHGARISKALGDYYVDAFRFGLLCGTGVFNMDTLRAGAKTAKSFVNIYRTTFLPFF